MTIGALAHGNGATGATVEHLVEQTLTAVREDLSERAYLFDDPDAYRAGIEDCLTAAEEQLAMEMAAAVYEQLDVLTHEIITPASVIQASAETLRSRGPNLSESDRSSILDSVCRNAQHLSKLLRDLRRPGAGEAPRVGANAELVEVDEVVRSVVEDENTVIGSARVRVAVPDEVGAGDAVAAIDPHSLRRILNALLSNAVKYGDSDGEITVAVEPAGDRVEVRVADEGPGIPEAHRESIFDKFHRLGSEGTGSGLGLYLARRLARDRGGDLVVESDDAEPGAVFLLTLTRAIEVPEPAVDRSVDSLPQQTPSRRSAPDPSGRS